MNTDTTVRSRLRLGNYQHPIYPEGLDSDKCAERYEAMRHNPHGYATEISYVHFKYQTIAQFEDLIASGLTIEYHNGEHEYACSAELLADLDAGHLWTLATDADNHGLPADHPMLEPVTLSTGETLLLNDIFRAVHDALGHGGARSNFALSGELEAWKAHRTHYNQDALPALWCETRGQSAWTNRWADHAELPLKDRPFADQKAGNPGYRYI